jgi:hypothetical protein
VTEQQHLVIAPDKLREIIDAHAGSSVGRAIYEELLDASMRTSVLDGAVVHPMVDVLGDIAHFMSRIANASDRPTPTITEELAIETWKKRVGPFYEDKAVPFLEALAIEIEKEPTRRV